MCIKKQISRRVLINEFDEYLLQTRGVTQQTRRIYIRNVKQFLKAIFKELLIVDPGHLKANDLIQFVVNQKKQCKLPCIKSMVTSLRSFLRFLQMKGVVKAELINAIPAVPDWKLSRVPKYLTQEQVEKLLASFNRLTGFGLRNYAITLCLARLGLRAGEVAHLCLDDIDWRSGIMHITSGKTRRSSLLPLPNDVGAAIVDYLRNGRPTTTERCIFVRHRDPVGISISSGAVSQVIRRGIIRAGLQVSSKGAHILRHTVATHMAQEGISIKEIADFLRHRSLDTTVIYTKVNLPMLLKVALPWPGKGVI